MKTHWHPYCTRILHLCLFIRNRILRCQLSPATGLACNVMVSTTVKSQLLCGMQISVSETGSMTSQLSVSTYYGLIKLLSTCVSGSHTVAEELLQLGISSTLHKLLRRSVLYIMQFCLYTHMPCALAAHQGLIRWRLRHTPYNLSMSVLQLSRAAAVSRNQQDSLTLTAH